MVHNHIIKKKLLVAKLIALKVIASQIFRIPMNFSFPNFFAWWIIFLVAKLLYKSKCPSVCPLITFRGKRDFLGP